MKIERIMDKKKIHYLYSLAESDTFDDAAGLSEYGFIDEHTVRKNLQKVSAVLRKYAKNPKGIFSNLLSLILESSEPERALNNVEKYLSITGKPKDIVSFLLTGTLFPEKLVTLFSGSQYLSDIAMKDEENINVLISVNLDVPKKKGTLVREIRSRLCGSVSAENSFSVIRKFKNSEYLRVGLRDLLRKGSTEEIVQELSDIADVCLEQVCRVCEAELVKKHGQPFYYTQDGEEKPSEFTIISLGKLGGRELNFSSDIDIIYLYSSDNGETKGIKDRENKYKDKLSLHDYYIKLSRKITNVLSEVTSDGNIFRVDLRLRPEGKKGDIAYSLRSYEIYYESWGETWERQMLIKARISAGSRTLGDEFLSMIHPFVYRKFLDFTALEEIRAVKERIDAELSARGKEKDNVKLGYGGIREIEFFVQSVQLIFGGKNMSIQQANTFRALKLLNEAELITDDDYTKLIEAYTFLRDFENRMQLSYAIRMQIIPEDAYQRWVLARKMGIQGNKREQVISALLSAYTAHCDNVRKIYDSLFYEKKEEESPYYIITSEDEDIASNYLKDFNFTDVDKAVATFKLLREGEMFTHPSEKSKIMFDKLLPEILKEIRLLPEPDLALLNLERFVSSSGSHENIYSFMLENTKVRELLLTLFGMSRFLSDILIRHPESFDAVLNPEEWGVSKSRDRLYDELSDILLKSSFIEKKMNEMRKFQKIEELKIGLRDFTLDMDLTDTFRDLSCLAEAYLMCALDIAEQKLSQKYGIPRIEKKSKHLPCPVVIIALGKLGGRELNFGSDLDLLFIYKDEGVTSGVSTGDGAIRNSIPNHLYFQKLYELIYTAASSITEAGYAYKIDLRLRPEGKKGVTVISLKQFNEYLEKRAETWERQALIKARAVGGNEKFGREFMDMIERFVYTNPFDKDDISQIDHIRKRMENELAMESEMKLDFKLGYGGIVDIEFIVQTLQLKYGGDIKKLRKPNTRKALVVLRDEKIIENNKAAMLLDAYLFLRRIENRLRIVHDTSLHSFAVSPDELNTLAVRMGYKLKNSAKAGSALLKEYKKYTKNIRDIYQEIFTNLLSDEA